MTSAPLRVPSPNLEDPETASLFGERASYGTVDGVGSGKLKQLGRTESDLRRQRRNSDSEQQWRKFSTRLRYYVPVFAWLPSYSSFGGDFTAALTLTSLIVPQSISYATSLANLPVASGLYGAAIPALVYSLLGTSRQMSVGPEAALTLIIGETINKFILEEQHAHGPLEPAAILKLMLGITSIITFEAGLITLGLGLLRLGFLDAVLSRALLRGFVSAVAIVILIAQLPSLLGLREIPTTIDNSLDKLFWTLKNIRHTHFLSLAISIVALLVLIFAKVVKAKLQTRRGFRHLAFIPEVLGVVCLSTLICFLARWDLRGVEILGHVSAEGVKITLPFHSTLAKGYLRQCIGTSTVIAVLGFLDSIVAAHDSGTKFDYAVSPNRELVALGAGNIVASFFSGVLPGYGSITRSRLAGNTGARTQMASFLTGIFVLLVAYFFLGALYYLPRCILASIVCVVVFSILQESPEELKFFYRLRATSEILLMGLTFVLTLCVSVEAGIGVSVFLSMLLCIRQSSTMRIKILGRIGTSNEYEPLEEDELGQEEEIPGVLIVKIYDSLTFANAGTLKDRLRRLERYGHRPRHPSEPPTREAASVVIFEMGGCEGIDGSALLIMHEAVKSYREKAVLVFWVRVPTGLRSAMEKAGIFKLSESSSTGNASHIQPSVHEALEALARATATFEGI